MMLKSKFDVEHVKGLAAQGYEYVVVQDAVELDFELPAVPGGLRIHRKPFEECESCSA